MRLNEWIIIFLSLVILTTIFSGRAEANHRWNLLDKYEYNPSIFKEREIGNKIVYYYQRKIDEALVERDYVIYHFDRETQELLDVKMHWREDLSPVLPNLNVGREQAKSMVQGTVLFSRLYIISPESSTFRIKPTPGNPCWIVTSFHTAKGQLITVIDAVNGPILGYGEAPPYTVYVDSQQ